jgi:hypothetical protein
MSFSIPITSKPASSKTVYRLRADEPPGAYDESYWHAHILSMVGRGG